MFISTGLEAIVYENIVAAFRGMHVLPAKHSYASVTDGRTDRQTDRQTDGKTDGRTTDKVIPMCRYDSQVTQKFLLKIIQFYRSLIQSTNNPPEDLFLPVTDI